tara:strand:+ start:157 stop:627 length:471 start_codon:yes stop_codon:yes gene_type:complete
MTQFELKTIKAPLLRKLRKNIKMTDKTKKEEIKFTKQFMSAMALFLVILAVRTFALEWYEYGTITKALIAISPVIPMFYALWAYVKHYRSMDEYMQRITGESFLWAIGVISFSSFAYGLLQYEMDVPAISLAWFMPAVIMGSGLVRIILLGGNHGK